MIYLQRSALIQGCTILENKVDYTFYFYKSSDDDSDVSIIVINCTITEDDINKIESNGGSVNIDNWSPSFTFKNEIYVTYLTDLCPVIKPTPKPSSTQNPFYIIQNYRTYWYP